jgi:hypothetical protein
VQSALVQQIPFLRREGKPLLNALGEPVENNPWARLVSPDKGDELWNTLAAKQAWTSVPSQGDMTDAEYYDLMYYRGDRLRARLEAALPRLRELDDELAQEVVRRISADETAKVKGMLGL